MYVVGSFLIYWQLNLQSWFFFFAYKKKRYVAKPFIDYL